MKKILLSIIALCSTMWAGAQNEILTAVLHHGSDTKSFTGVNAFIQANAAADDGDVITLSPGSFNVSDIKKSITVYGAGFEKNDAADTEVTVLSGQLNIGASGVGTLTGVHLEGINFNNNINANVPLEDAVIEKSYVSGYISFVDNTNTKIENCVVKGAIKGGYKSATNCSIKNCYIGGEIMTFAGESSVVIDHCIACNLVGPYTCTNSIFTYYVSVATKLATFCNTSGATVNNCIVRNFEDNNQTSNDFQNCYAVDLAEIFTDGIDYGYSAERTFEIKQPETWTGTDGEAIGIRYGWSKVPRTPMVKNVTTTVSGENLNVKYDIITR